MLDVERLLSLPALVAVATAAGVVQDCNVAARYDVGRVEAVAPPDARLLCESRAEKYFVICREIHGKMPCCAA